MIKMVIYKITRFQYSNILYNTSSKDIFIIILVGDLAYGIQEYDC